MFQEAQFAAIVEQIHEALLEPARWQQVLQSIGQVVGAQSGSVFIHDFSDSSVSFDSSGVHIASCIGFEGSSLVSFAAYCSTVNVWTAREDPFPPGPVTAHMLFPNEALKRTEFYGDWLRRVDLLHALGLVVERDRSRGFLMTFLRPEGCGDFEGAPLALTKALMPHIRTAVRVHRRMHGLQAVADASLTALDAMSFGVVLLSQDGSFLHWNETARAISSRTGVLSTGASCALLCTTPGLTTRLATTVRQSVDAAHGQGGFAGSVLRLPGLHGETVQLFVAPAPASSDRFGTGVGAVLFMKESTGAAVDLAASLRSIYQLTAAEAALAEALIEGKSLKVFADERGVTLNTVKSQLKQVTMKVGVKRQVDVVREILTGPAVLHMGHAEIRRPRQSPPANR